MPVKFQKSQTTYIKNTNKYVTTHFYVKSMTNEALLEEINRPTRRPKSRVKCIRELERRGVNFNWVPSTKEEANAN